MLPEARIGHLTAGRIRIKVPSRKGDAGYFAKLEEKLSGFRGLEGLQLNPLTGSVLLTAGDIDPAAVARFGKSEGLFRLDTAESHPVALSHRVVHPIEQISQSLRRFTGGEVDLAGLAFLGLLSVGVYQILRGEFRAPPWYTAFWYALGVFTKLAVDREQTDT